MYAPLINVKVQAALGISELKFLRLLETAPARKKTPPTRHADAVFETSEKPTKRPRR